MARWKVMVTSCSGEINAAEIVARNLSAAWRDGESAMFCAATLEDLESAALEQISAVVLVDHGTLSLMQPLRALAMLEEAAVPVIALTDHAVEAGDAYDVAGAKVISAARPMNEVAATLEGILHQGRAIVELRRELSVAQRFQGGLRGEIARMHEELQLAAMVQREYLPREMPSLYGVEFSTLWRPANYVSGDIYEVVQLDEDHIGVFLADAVGHGVPAALMTMVICQSLHLTRQQDGSTLIVSPGEVLARLNAEMIRRQGRTTRFATAVYAVVDCRSRLLKVAGAGHPPPLLVRSDGSSRLLDTPGGLLGVFADEEYGEIEVELAIGDHLLFYSDGFEQAFPHDDAADEYALRVPTNRYRKEFERLCDLRGPDSMVDALSKLIDDQRGSLHQVDDLTLVCMYAGELSSMVHEEIVATQIVVVE